MVTTKKIDVVLRTGVSHDYTSMCWGHTFTCLDGIDDYAGWGPAALKDGVSAPKTR
jgi:hypothetical protein